MSKIRELKEDSISGLEIETLEVGLWTLDAIGNRQSTIGNNNTAVRSGLADGSRWACNSAGFKAAEAP
jgi:hypothetical protein